MYEHDPEVLAAFAEESAQRIAGLEAGLLALERNAAGPDPELLNAAFRDAHSIKAGAGLLGLAPIEQAAHRLENVLDLLRAGRLAPEPAVCQALFDGVDLLRELIDEPDPGRLPGDRRLAALAALAGA